MIRTELNAAMSLTSAIGFGLLVVAALAITLVGGPIAGVLPAVGMMAKNAPEDDAYVEGSMKRVAKQEKRKQKKKRGQGGGGGSQDPVTARQAKRVKLAGGVARGGGVTASTTRTAPIPPMLTVIDTRPISAKNIGLSSAWQIQANVLASGYAPSGDLARWAFWTTYPGGEDQYANTVNANSPFGTLQLARKGAYIVNRKGANTPQHHLAPESGLQAQYDWTYELHREVGAHVAFLHHCIDVSRIYQDQIAGGPVGYTEAHITSVAEYTPYQRYYETLMEQFDPVALGINQYQSMHYTLETVARKALDLVFTATRAELDSNSWVASETYPYIADAFDMGYNAIVRGMMSDNDGNQRLKIDPPRPVSPTGNSYIEQVMGPTPVDGDIPDQAGQIVIDGDNMETFSLSNVNTELRDSFRSAFYNSDDNWVTLSLKDGLHFPGSGTPFDLMPSWAVGPRRTTGRSAFVNTDYDLTTSPNNPITDVSKPRQLWTMDTPHLMRWVRFAHEAVDATIYGLDFERVGSVLYEPMKTCTYGWRDFVDYENALMRRFTMRFNPTHNREPNNGPYWRGNKSKWTLADLEDDLKEQMAQQAYNDVTVPTALGSFKNMDVPTLLSLVPNTLFDHMLTTSINAAHKLERNIIVPADRSSPQDTMFAGEKSGNMVDLLSLMTATALHGVPNHYTLMPGTDVVHTSTTQPFTSGRLELLLRGAHTSSTGNLRLGGYAIADSYLARESVDLDPSTLTNTVLERYEYGGRTSRYEDIGIGPAITSIQVGPRITLEMDVASTLDAIATHEPESGFGPHSHALFTQYGLGAVGSNSPKPSDFTGTVIGPEVKATTNARNILLAAADPPNAKSGNGTMTIGNATHVATGTFAINKDVGVKLIAQTDDDFTWQYAKDFPQLVGKTGADLEALKAELDAVVKNSASPATYSIYQTSGFGIDLSAIPEAERPLEEITWIVAYMPDAAKYQLNPGGTAFIAPSSATVLSDQPLLYGAQLLRVAAHRNCFGNIPVYSGPDVPIGGTPTGSLTFMSAMDVEGVRPTYNLVRPESLNYKFTPHMDLFDAAVFEYSKMRFYLRADTEFSDAYGLPYHGTPEPFVRALIPKALENYDPLWQSPFLTTVPGMLRVQKVFYNPAELNDQAVALLRGLGEGHMGTISVDSVIAAQDLLLRRRMGRI
jgi:hypothetical protein